MSPSIKCAKAYGLTPKFTLCCGLSLLSSPHAPADLNFTASLDDPNTQLMANIIVSSHTDYVYSRPRIQKPRQCQRLPATQYALSTVRSLISFPSLKSSLPQDPINWPEKLPMPKLVINSCMDEASYDPRTSLLNSRRSQHYVAPATECFAPHTYAWSQTCSLTPLSRSISPYLPPSLPPSLPCPTTALVHTVSHAGQQVREK